MRQSDIARIVDETSQLVRRHYVFPALGEELSTLLDQHAATGRYAAADSAAALADLVTTDLQSRNGDRHLRLVHHEVEIPDLPGEEATRALRVREAAGTMRGISRIERLDGNIALLAISPILFPPEIAGDAIAAAMQLVTGADALILDLRGCRGGTPGSVALLCSYLVDDDTHLNDMYLRDGDRTIQSWTLPYVPGARFGGTKPVSVLTSSGTFSGGEELAYDLQQLGRATVIGETTRGGAHPRIGIRVHPHLEASVPTGRSVHPVTHTNWEGVGVIPDIPTSADQALATAHQHAQRALTVPR